VLTFVAIQLCCAKAGKATVKNVSAKKIKEENLEVLISIKTWFAKTAI
jgi:hypothetical protein